jgi:chromosome condensin MukBEF MukE localization factor
MTDLLHLGDIFDRLKRGAHLGPDDEPLFSALVDRYTAYAAYFAPLGLQLIRHEREFFYFEPENADTIPDTLPRIAIFSYILVDFAANQGRPIEEFIFGQNFLISALPHFGFDRYAALLRQVEVHDSGDVETILKHMDRIGWVKILGPDEFRFLKPFHRVFSRCIEIAQSTSQPAASQPAASTTP